MLGAIRVLLLPPRLTAAWCLSKYRNPVLMLNFTRYWISSYIGMDEMQLIVRVYVVRSLRAVRFLDRLPK